MKVQDQEKLIAAGCEEVSGLRQKLQQARWWTHSLVQFM